jgi:hypothetical protein
MGLDSVSSLNLEYQDLERHDLLTGEPRYIEDEVRNTTIAIVLGIAGLIFCIVASILAWILFYRDRNYSFLWHPIWLIVIILFTLAAIAWAFSARSAIKTGRQPNSLFTLIIFLLGLIATGYLMITALWYIFYRVIHYDYLVGIRTDINLWNHRMPSGSTFEEGWMNSKRMIWWTVFFTLAAATCYAFIAFAARSAVWNRYQLTRFGLYGSLAWIVLASWLVLYWGRYSSGYKTLMVNDDVDNQVTMIRILAIVALVFAMVNLVANIFKSRLGYFICGILMAVLFVLLICTNALLWREIRTQQQREQRLGSDSSCVLTMSSMHENDVKSYCPFGSKYLEQGQTCGKEFLVQRWEGNNEIRSLNPACCLIAKHFYLWPYMLLAYWTFILFIAVALVTLFDFYLGDTTSYLSNANKTLGIGDYLFIALILAIFVGLLIYFLVRDYQVFKNANRALYYDSYEHPSGPESKTTVEGFDRVPNQAINTLESQFGVPNATVNNFCYPFNTSVIYNPTFNTNYPNCSNPSTCSIRLALGSLDGALKFSDQPSASRASVDSRYNFFPNCNTLNTYAMFWGTEDQLRTLLSTVQICPDNPSVSPSILVYSDQVPTTSITSAGITTFETGRSFSGISDCKGDFTEGQCGPGPQCRLVSSFQEQFQYRTLKGRYYYVKDGQKRYDIPSTIYPKAYFQGLPIGVNETVLADGVFFIKNIPMYYSNKTWVLTVETNDTSNQFLYKKSDFVIERHTPEDFSLGEIRLLTRDASICPFNDTTCINNQKLATGKIHTVTIDGRNPYSTTNPLGQVTIKAIYHHTVNDSTPVATITTDENGVGTFLNIPYGPYSLVAFKTGYRPMIQLVDLQTPTLNPNNFVLENVDNTEVGRVVANMNGNGADYDLVLQIKSDKGNFCEVSPYNKFCPWTGHITDVTGGPGEELIIMRRLSIANYNAFVRQVPPYDSSCTAGDVIKANAYHFQSLKKISWSHVQGSAGKWARPITPGLIKTNTYFRWWILNIQYYIDILRYYPGVYRFETDSDAQRNRTGINFGGNALNSTNGFSANSYFFPPVVVPMRPPIGYKYPLIIPNNTSNNPVASPCYVVIGQRGEISNICNFTTTVAIGSSNLTNTTITNDTKFTDNSIINATSVCVYNLTQGADSTSTCVLKENTTNSTGLTRLREDFLKTEYLTSAGVNRSDFRTSVNTTVPNQLVETYSMSNISNRTATSIELAAVSNNVTTYQNGTIQTIQTNYSQAPFSNGTLFSTSNNYTAYLTPSNPQVVGTTVGVRAVSYVYPNGTNETWQVANSSYYYPSNSSNVTVQNQSYIVDGSANSNSITTSHSQQLLNSAPVVFLSQPNDKITLSNLMTIVLSDTSSNKANVAAMNSQQAWFDLETVGPAILEGLTKTLSLAYERFRYSRISVQPKNPSQQQLNQTLNVYNDSYFFMTPTSSSGRSNIYINDTVNITTGSEALGLVGLNLTSIYRNLSNPGTSGGAVNNITRELRNLTINNTQAGIDKYVFNSSYSSVNSTNITSPVLTENRSLEQNFTNQIILEDKAAGSLSNNTINNTLLSVLLPSNGSTYLFNSTFNSTVLTGSALNRSDLARLVNLTDYFNSKSYSENSSNVIIRLVPNGSVQTNVTNYTLNISDVNNKTGIQNYTRLFISNTCTGKDTINCTVMNSSNSTNITNNTAIKRLTVSQNDTSFYSNTSTDSLNGTNISSTFVNSTSVSLDTDPNVDGKYNTSLVSRIYNYSNNTYQEYLLNSTIFNITGKTSSDFYQSDFNSTLIYQVNDTSPTNTSSLIESSVLNNSFAPGRPERFVWNYSLLGFGSTNSTFRTLNRTSGNYSCKSSDVSTYDVCSNFTNTTLWVKTLTVDPQNTSVINTNDTFIMNTRNFTDDPNSTIPMNSTVTLLINITNTTQDTVADYDIRNYTVENCTTGKNCTKYMISNRSDNTSASKKSIQYNTSSIRNLTGKDFKNTLSFTSTEYIPQGTLINTNVSNTTWFLNNTIEISYNAGSDVSSSSGDPLEQVVTVDNYYQLISRLPIVGPNNFTRTFSTKKTLTPSNSTNTSNIARTVQYEHTANYSDPEGNVNNFSFFTDGAVNTVFDGSNSDLNTTWYSGAKHIPASGPANQFGFTYFNSSNVTVNGKDPNTSKAGNTTYYLNISYITYTINYTSATTASNIGTYECVVTNNTRLASYNNGSNVTEFSSKNVCKAYNGSTITTRNESLAVFEVGVKKFTLNQSSEIAINTDPADRILPCTT